MEDDSQHYQGDHRTRSRPKESNPKENRWEIWLRIFLSFLLGAFSAAFFLGGKSRDIADLLVWKGEVSTELRRMDREGTNRSHWIDEQQSVQITTTLAKIAELEKKSEARGETINVMQGKIERIESEIKRP